MNRRFTFFIPEPFHSAGIISFCLAALLISTMLADTAWGQRRRSVADRVMLGVRFEGVSSVLSYIKPNGPADRAGLQVGDEIFSIGDQYVLQSSDLLRALEEKKPGTAVKVEVRRQGQYRFFDLMVMKATENGERVAEDGTILPPLPKYTLVGKPAPELYISQWKGLPDGQTRLRLGDLRGKVVFVLLFQTTCQFSRQDGLPIMAKLYERHQNDADIQFVAIQNSAPRFEENTLDSAFDLCGEFKLPIPVGHDDSDDKSQTVCKSFNAPGTPWIILMDRQGVVQFDGTPAMLTDLDVLEKLKRGENIGEDAAESTGQSTPEDGQPEKKTVS